MRSKISITHRQFCAEAAENLLSKSNLFKDSHHIAIYLPFKNEFDTKPIINSIWLANKKCYLPVVSLEKQLFFAAYSKKDKLKQNHYGILEPEEKSNFINPHELDLVVMPLFAVDKQGHRLGSGGGYYDRTFSYLNNSTKGKKQILIGLGYSMQIMTNLPFDSWDVNLNAILTEKEIMLINI